jgi:KUP system potassium uptake protein
VSKQLDKVTLGNLVIALGIIYGDIGTSPLYVLNAIINGRVISEMLIIGSLSCIIWTLTLQTTIKYVWLTLKADNKGEGGIFSLYALVRRQRRWLVERAEPHEADFRASAIGAPDRDPALGAAVDHMR